MICVLVLEKKGLSKIHEILTLWTLFGPSATPDFARVATITGETNL